MHIDVGGMFGPTGEEMLAAQQLAIAREAAEIQREVDRENLEQRNQLHMEAFALRMQTTREMSEQELQAIVAGGKAINDAQAAHMQSVADVASAVTGVVGQAITDLISAQRAYEMNSKVITTADEMASIVSKNLK